MTPPAGDLLADARTGKNGRHALVGIPMTVQRDFWGSGAHAGFTTRRTDRLACRATEKTTDSPGSSSKRTGIWGIPAKSNDFHDTIPCGGYPNVAAHALRGPAMSQNAPAVAISGCHDFDFSLWPMDCRRSASPSSSFRFARLVLVQINDERDTGTRRFGKSLAVRLAGRY